MPVPATSPVIRAATPDDIEGLVLLEAQSFDSDQLTRRNFRYMLTRANAALHVGELEGQIVGYVLVLFHRGTSLARLYSIAVSAAARGFGLGQRLLDTAEDAARERRCAYMRLEVRPNNDSAIQLYEKNGYRLFEIVEDYYDDHVPAKRYEKRIREMEAAEVIAIPYYEQTTDFTCGPAALMMAMGTLDPSIKLDQSLELQLWREATTVFMMSGNGGCGPHGLALAAHRRGFVVEVYLNSEDPLFVGGVRNQKKKEIIELVQRDFEKHIKKTDIRVHRKSISIKNLSKAIENGSVPIVLISTYRLTSNKAPHWVTITGIDDDYVYVHDPESDEDSGKSSIDRNHVPIEGRLFERMSRYGSRGLRASIVLSKRK